ncbi:putative ribonuclease H-like domain-containing protein [Tanacetum coccineum]|uniref:Ribonuclease H-like domain-containing protein n=1 Tax=Tanacetum coccineum TaxID=301880 RepID=A0ABQ4ZWS6_9ASTR
MMALTEVEQDDWSMEFDAEHVHFGQDGLGDFDWSNKADDTPMEYDLKIRDLKLEEKQKELDQALKERDDFKDLGLSLSGTLTKGGLSFHQQYLQGKELKVLADQKMSQQYLQKVLLNEILIKGNPEEDLKDYAIIDSGCSRRSNLFGCRRQTKMKLSYGTEDLGMSTSRIYNTLVKGNSGFEVYLPRTFKLDHSCLACRKVNSTWLLARRLKKDNENQKGNGPDWMFDLELLTPSMNYIPVRKENYADSGGNVSTHDDVDDLDDQQFIVHGPNIHTAQNTPSEERTANKEVPLNAFEKEKKRIALEKGKECVDSTFTLSTANTPPQSTGNTPTDSDDDIPNDGVFSTNSFDAENTDTEEGGAADYNNMDPTIDVTSTPTLRIHKIHPQSQIIGKSTDGILTRRKLKEKQGVEYDEVFAPVARIEAIRLFLAFASFMGFTVYQMDVKSAFLYGNITEEVYVKQPPGFEDPAHPNKVYRVVKALYGLHQAPRAWYERLSTFLLKHGYRRGAIDKTLFIKKDRRDIMLVQVYVDDIIFGSTKSSMVKDFEDLMQKEFKMSSMGELTFFLGLQVKQTSAGIFLSQDKYVKDILNKFDFRTIKPASTPIEAHKSLGKDEEGEDVDVHLYRSMIGCLMYLTASRPDIMFAVCLCARFQVTPKVSHLHAVKRIFRLCRDNRWIDDQLQENVNIMEEDWSLANARNKQLSLSPPTEQNM